MVTYPPPNDPVPAGYIGDGQSELIHQMQLANAARLETKHWQDQSREADKRIIKLQQEATAFAEFVYRHTLPARAKERTHEETHSILVNHPFAKDWL